MSHIPKSGPAQAMPPPGGFPAIDYKRNLPRRGPHGITLFIGVTAIVTAGMVIMGNGNIERRRIKQEQVASRIALVPLLQAEEDLRYLRAKAEGLEQEAKLMADVQGWEVGKSPYHTERYVPPTQVTPLGVIP